MDEQIPDEWDDQDDQAHGEDYEAAGKSWIAEYYRDKYPHLRNRPEIWRVDPDTDPAA